MWRKLFDCLKRKNYIRYGRTQKASEEVCTSHYTEISYLYHIISFIILIATAVFIIVALIFNLNSITYDNFYYFIKDFDAILTSENYSSFSVDYSYENNRSYIEYKGGFATIGQSSLLIYSATGRQTGRFYHRYSSPELKGSSKYLVIYDQDGNDFAIYNSFARLYTETISTPICLVEICDNGEFAIVTTNDKYRSVIYLYNSSFKRIGAYYYTEHVTSVSLCSDGEHMMVSLADTDNGSVSSEILLYVTDSIELYESGEKEADVIVNDEDSVIIACGISNHGGAFHKNQYYYLSIDDVSMLNGKEQLHKYNFGLDLYSEYAIDEDGIAVVVEHTNNYVMYIESNELGNMEISLEDKPLAVAKNGKYIFVGYSDCVVRYNIKSGIYQKLMCAIGPEDIIASAEDSVIVCYPSRALSMDFK